jgi:predicted short-subunit dehydrogenase-like oxidoreductase (DUF2520 family)
MTEPIPSTLRCAVIGRGRLGPAIAAALRAAGVPVDGPLGRGADPLGADLVLLAVPDAEIAAAAAAVTPGPLVGHCSGATTLAPLHAHGAQAFSLHPLMTITPAGATFAGATAAVAGASDRALDAATVLATTLGLRPVTVADADRAVYHAAASVAANFLVTLQDAAERLAAVAGLDRAALLPLAQAALDNWAALGGEQALTGPIARGDEVTVRRQRAAVADRAPELTDLFDALAVATRDLAARRAAHGPAPTPAPTAVVGSNPHTGTNTTTAAGSTTEAA